MQRSYRLVITALISVLVLYKLFTYGSDSSSDSSWSRAHPESKPDLHKDVIAGDQKVSDKVSEPLKVAEHALDALPGGYKGTTSGSSSSAPPIGNSLANAT